MKLPQCNREQEVLDALRSERWASAWGEELRQHVEACPMCAEVAWVAREFQREAELARRELQQTPASLPSAGLVWWKAQRAARRAAEQRAAEPIVWVERAAMALGLLVALGLGVWQWPHLAAWLQRAQIPQPLLPFSAVNDLSASAGWFHRLTPAWFGQTPVFLLAASAVAFLTFMAFAAYVVWRED